MSQPLLGVAAVAELPSAIGTLVVSATPLGIARLEFKHRVTSCAEAVSYTHLTLPTKA